MPSTCKRCSSQYKRNRYGICTQCEYYWQEEVTKRKARKEAREDAYLERQAQALLHGCSVCGHFPRRRRLSADMKGPGVLCYSCRMLLSNCARNKDRLQKLIDYLETCQN